jgi:hypothetical protein
VIVTRASPVGTDRHRDTIGNALRLNRHIWYMAYQIDYL